MALDEDDVQDDAPDQTEKPGSRAAAADRLIADRIRNNPPPPIGGAPEDAGSPPARPGQERGAPTPARADRQASPPSEGGPEPTRSERSEVEPDENAWRKYVERYGGDEEKAKRHAWETESRAAELARERDELKAKLEGKPSAEDTPAPTPPAPEFTEEEFKKQLAAEQAAFVKDDPECGRLVAQYQEKVKEAEKYGTPTEDGRFVGGTIEKLEEELKLEARNLERGKVGSRDLDPVERDEIKEAVRELKDKLRDEKEAAQAQWLGLRRLETSWDRRVGAFQKAFQKTWAEQAQAEVRERTSAEAATKAEREWNTAFKPLKEGLSEKDADRLETQLLLRASAIVRDGADMPDLDGWLSKTAEDIRADWADLRGETDRSTTQQRLQDTRRPTPPGTAAVAPETVAQGSARDRRRAADRLSSQRVREAIGSAR